MILEIIVAFISFIALVPCIWFIVGYWIVTGGAWMKQEAGIFLMSFMTILGLLFLIGIIGTWYQPVWLAPVGMAAFLLLVAQMWWPLRLLIVAQRERSTDKKCSDKEA